MHMYNYKIEKYLTCLNNEIGTVRVKQVGILIMKKKTQELNAVVPCMKQCMIVFSFVLISRVSEHTFVCHFAYMCSTEPPTGLWSFLFHYLLLLLPVTFSLL